MQFLRQSTASQEISLGQFLDSTDGDTEEGGLTIANTDIKIRKHGGTTLINKASGGATVISNGVYQATLDATDTNTAGMLEIYVHVAGALAVKSVYTVLTATAFDALLTGTFNNLGGTAQTADHTAGIAAIPTTAMRGTDSAALATVCTETRLAELDAGNLPTDIAAIPTTAMRGTDNAATSAKQNTMETTLNAIPTTAMRGTDGANTVVPDAAGTAPTGPEINAELVDVLENDAHAEPTGVVGATATIKDAIMWVKTVLRNTTTQTATTTSLRNDADTLDISTSTVSDDGSIFTKGKHT